jgi:hypothetical protein
MRAAVEAVRRKAGPEVGDTVVEGEIRIAEQEAAVVGQELAVAGEAARAEEELVPVDEVAKPAVFS